ncbi:MAG TPA: hypothetical protein VGB45_08415 [Abditibacterium sp.]
MTGAALVLWATRPQFSGGPSQDVDANTASCLSNLSQISRAYAQYARDYDGKIPRGVDPEDRFSPHIWRDSGQYGAEFYDDATKTPFLHEILRPYVASNEVFHCPADVGWEKTRLPLGAGSLRNVRPSSFQKFGTSYYCWTKYGFALYNASDIENPAQTILLFDGDLWHSNAGRQLINGLFADGHVQNLTTQQFTQFSPN